MPHPIGEALLKKESPRILRHRVREFLGSGNLEQVLRELKKIPQRKAINSLIEYEPLRRGALWGIGRLAQVYPEMLIEFEAAKYIRPYLEDDDPPSRELSAQALRMLGDETDR